ncbi:MAG: hypothetical protein ABRQ39_05220 [Candidatus Eremiobacterota bacterium]
MKRLTCLVILLLVCSFSVAKGEDYFDYKYYDGRGLVTFSGMTLMSITDKAGKLTPYDRAKVIADRLNYLLNSGKNSPESFIVGYNSGEVVIQSVDPSGKNIIVTVDGNMAKKFRGAGGSRTTLAYWWLSLLRDNLLITQGLQPRYAVPYGKGYALERIYMKAIEHSDYEGGPISPSILQDTVRELSYNDPAFINDINQLYTSIPAEFNLASASSIDKDLSYNYSTDKPSVPGPGFNETRYYASTIEYPEPTPKPTPKVSVSYSEKPKVTPKPTPKVTYVPPPKKTPEPYYEETYTPYTPTYYEPPVLSVPDFPSDAPQTLPPNMRLNNLKITSDGLFSTSFDGKSDNSISQVHYILMNSSNEQLQSETVTAYPFKCNLKKQSEAKFFQVKIDYKNGKSSSTVYKLN